MVITEELKQFIRQLVKEELANIEGRIDRVDEKYEIITKDIKTDIFLTITLLLLNWKLVVRCWVIVASIVTKKYILSFLVYEKL